MTQFGNATSGVNLKVYGDMQADNIQTEGITVKSSSVGGSTSTYINILSSLANSAYITGATDYTVSIGTLSEWLKANGK